MQKLYNETFCISTIEQININFCVLTKNCLFLKGREMTRSGRFGKYGDLKRKEQMRSTGVLRAELARESFASAKAGVENRHRKTHKRSKGFYGV
jgi:hypothetical protein